MKSAVTLFMLAIAVSLGVSVSAGPPVIVDTVIDEIEMILPPPGVGGLVPHEHGHWATSHQTGQPVKPVVPKPVWKIPAGKYGLHLKNGTRILGRPVKGWSAKLKTNFGTVSIPLAQIARLDSAGNGQCSVFLKNGDRVSGILVSNVLSFETEFGTMTVPTADLVRLSSATPTAKRSTVPATRLNAGDRVIVEWGGTNWNGRVLQLFRDGNVKIHYEGWGAEWDEVVPRTRLQLPPNDTVKKP